MNNTPRDAFRDHINSLSVAEFDTLISELLEFIEMFDYEPSYPDAFPQLHKFREAIDDAE